MQPTDMAGFTVWLTGMPCSGKSTLGQLMQGALTDRGLRVDLLDGDEVKRRLSKGLGFSKEDRDENIRRISYVASIVTRHSGVAITCAKSPYRAVRDEARREIGRFIEVYVKCPLEVCIRRDVKGMYKKAQAGEIANFTGISDPYEEPLGSEVIVETEIETPGDSLHKILSTIERLGYLSGVQTNNVNVPLPTRLAGRINGKLSNRYPNVASYVILLVEDSLGKVQSESSCPLPLWLRRV